MLEADLKEVAKISSSKIAEMTVRIRKNIIIIRATTGLTKH